jgi:hypothetical protein
MEITSNHETAEEMVKVLAPIKENGKEPRVIRDQGAAPAEPENPLSKAAAELGKAGGKAAAEARAKAEKEPTKSPDPAPAPVKAEEPEAEDKSKKGDPRFDPRARVMEATREAKEQRERAEKLEARVRELEAKAAAPETKSEPKPEPKADAGRDKPKVEDYETYEEFVEKLTDWKAEERERKRAEAAEKEGRHRALEAQHGAFFGRMQKAFEANPDMREKIAGLVSEMTPTALLALRGEPATAQSDLAQAIVESEVGPALLLHFAENPEEYQKILRLPDSYSVARYVGRLEAKFDKSAQDVSPEPAPKPKSQAPPPLKPVAAGSVSAEPDITGDIDFKTFMARKKQAR